MVCSCESWLLYLEIERECWQAGVDLVVTRIGGKRLRARAEINEVEAGALEVAESIVALEIGFDCRKRRNINGARDV